MTGKNLINEDNFRLAFVLQAPYASRLLSTDLQELPISALCSILSACMTALSASPALLFIDFYEGRFVVFYSFIYVWRCVCRVSAASGLHSAHVRLVMRGVTVDISRHNPVEPCKSAHWNR